MSYPTPIKPRPEPECQNITLYDGAWHACEYGLAEHDACRCACGYFWNAAFKARADERKRKAASIAGSAPKRRA